jgi:exopolysaccharide biosynthesis predicted pyruvyltransferase EpsI
MTEKDWDEVSSNRLIEQDYIFCYFLGNDKRMRSVAADFAKKKGLKLVSIPHLMGSYERSDYGFPGIKARHASPNDFVSLIKNAKYVITDSFHAVSFSIVYGKEFFVFQRANQKGMASRIYSILDLVSCLERFCDSVDKMTADYLVSLSEKELSIDMEALSRKRITSIDFLRSNL